MLKYEILTSRSVMDIPYESEEQNQRDCEALVEEQNRIIQELAPSEYYMCHFIEDPHYCDDITINVSDLDDAIQYLAIKDGVDLVRFENGNLGYVAYYNCHENGFEFKPISKKEFLEED